MENKICSDHGEDLEKFNFWIKLQPKLPQNMENILLLRYLKVCEFDQEKAKKLLRLNLEIRNKNSHIFNDRDVQSEEMQNVLKTVMICPLPTFTKEKYKISLFRLIDDDPNKFDYVNTVKWNFMADDVRYITYDSVGLTEGEISIMDAKGFSFRHFVKVAANLATLRLYLTYVQEAVPFKIIQNHFVNCSPILTKIMSLIRPFLKKELFDVIHFHTESFASLKDHIPMEALPYEYGGAGGSLDDMYGKWIKHVENKREYLNNDNHWAMS